MSNDDVCVLVPMYNEARVISGVLDELRSRFPHVVCVDDGSSDESVELARAAGATIVRHPINLGQGAALQTGFNFIRTRRQVRYVVTFDADGQHRVEDAVQMIAKARADDLDVVLASRFAGSTSGMPRARAMILGAAVRFTRWSAGIDVTDAHNGLRVIDVRVLDRLRLAQPGMAHASELLNQVGSLGLSYAEVPATIVYTDYSRAKSQRNINSVNILFDLAMAKLRSHP